MTKGTSPPAEEQVRECHPDEEIKMTAAMGLPRTRRISGVKIFTSQATPEAVNKLNEHIMDWIRANPSLELKEPALTALPAGKDGGMVIAAIWY